MRKRHEIVKKKLLSFILIGILLGSMTEGWWSQATEPGSTSIKVVSWLCYNGSRYIPLGDCSCSFDVSWTKNDFMTITGFLDWPSFIDDEVVSSCNLQIYPQGSINNVVQEFHDGYGSRLNVNVRIRSTCAINPDKMIFKAFIIMNTKLKKVIFHDTSANILAITKAKDDGTGNYTLKTITPPPGPSGTSFIGWSKSQTTYVGVGAKEPASSFSGDTLKLYAFYDTTVDVTFNGNGASGPIPDKIVYSKYGSYKFPQIDSSLTKQGYSFAGWGDAVNSYTNGGTVYQPEDTLTLTDPTNDKTYYAQWAKNYTVDYNMNGSAASAPQSQTAAAKSDGSAEVTVSSASNFTRPGFNFEGWSTNQAASTAEISPGDKITVSDDTTLYAVWSGKKYKISFDDNGADPASNPGISDISASYGDTVTLPDTALTKDYHIFKGWTADDQGGGTVYQPGGSFTIGDSTPENLTLYAVWKEADKYTLSFDKGGGDDVKGTPPIGGTYYNDGVHDQVSLPVCTLTRPGYTFAGWSKTQNGTLDYADGSTFTITENTTLHAVWTEGEFSLTYDFNGEGDALHGTMPTNIQGGPSSNITASPQGSMAREFYRFTGWNTQANGGGAAYAPEALIYLDHNMTLYAQWEALSPVRLTYNNSCDDPLVAVPTDTKPYYDDGVNDKGQVSTELPDRFGYNFKGWNTEQDGTGTAYQPGAEIVVTDNTELFAIWEEGTYTLTYSRNAAGASGDLPDDVTGKLAATVRAGSADNLTYAHHHFKEWNTKADGTGTGYQPGKEVALGRDMTLYAIWEKNIYEVDYNLNADNAVGVVPDTASGSYDETFTAPEQTGITRPKYRPIGWNDDPEGKGTDYTPKTTYSFEKDTTLYVKWEAVPPYEVHYFKNADDATGDPPEDENTYCEDGVTPTSVTVLDDNGMKRPGYEFAGWNTKENGTGLFYQPGDNFIIKTHMNFYAQWKVGTYTLSFDKGHSAVTGSGPAAIQSRSDKYISLPKEGELKRKDFGFTGWNTKPDGSGTSYKDGDKIKILEDTTLYAQWKRLVNVSFDNSEGALKGDTSLQVTEGTKLGDVKLPSVNSGYTVKEWIINGQKVTDYKNYVVDEDSDVVLVLEKKKDPSPAPKPDNGGNGGNNKPDNKPDNNKPDGNKPDNSKPDGGSNGGSGGNDGGSSNSSGFGGGGSGSQSAGNGASGNNQKYSTGEVEPVGDNDLQGGAGGYGTDGSSLAAIEDEQVPLSAGASNLQSRNSAYGSPGDCIIHWLVLLGIVLYGIYTSLRYRHIRRRHLLQSHFLWDYGIVLAVWPLAAAAYLKQYCILDLPLIGLWLILSLASLYVLKKAYEKNLTEVEERILTEV